MMDYLDRAYRKAMTNEHGEKICSICSDKLNITVYTSTYISVNEKYLVEHCNNCHSIISAYDLEHVELIDKRH